MYLADGYTNAEPFVVADGVPLPVGVVEHVSRVQVSVLHRQVRGLLRHLGSAGHHVHLQAKEKEGVRLKSE